MWQPKPSNRYRAVTLVFKRRRQLLFSSLSFSSLNATSDIGNDSSPQDPGFFDSLLAALHCVSFLFMPTSFVQGEANTEQQWGPKQGNPLRFSPCACD